MTHLVTVLCLPTVFDVIEFFLFNCCCCDCLSIPAVWEREGTLWLLSLLPALLLLHHLLLEPLLSDSQHLRRFHGFVRLSVLHDRVK